MKQSLLRYSTPLIFLVFFFFTGIVSAQLISSNNAADPESEYSIEQLIREVLIDGNCAEVSDIRTNLIDAGEYIANQRPEDVRF